MTTQKESFTINRILIGEKLKFGLVIKYKGIEVLSNEEVVYSHIQKASMDSDSGLLRELDAILGFKKSEVSSNRSGNGCGFFNGIAKCWFKILLFKKKQI